MLRKLLITFFGTGFLPIAPGTWGSLAACTPFLILGVFGFSLPAVWIILAVLTAVAVATGIGLGRWSVEYFRAMDPKPYVLDEAAGMWLSLILIPFTGTSGLLLVTVVQFVLFRFYDVVKPAPARQAEALPFGWGIMTDDLIAALYANLTGQILFRLILSGVKFT